MKNITHIFESQLKTDKSAMYALIGEELEAATRLIRPEHRNLFDTEFRYIYEFTMNAGKAVRGSLALNVVRMIKGATADFMPVAATLELVNAYLLIIDDWLDNSLTRRGMPTTHERYKDLLSRRSANPNLEAERAHIADGMAVQAGMYVHSLSMRLLAKTQTEYLPELLSLMQSDLMLTGLGNILESHAATDTVYQTAETVELVYEYKTALYTIASAINTALTFLGRADLINKFEPVCYELGVAFQMQDDLIGVFGDPAKTGKSNSDDIREGIYTIITHTAKQMLSKQSYAELLSLHGKQDLSDQEAEMYRQLLIRHGVKDEVTKIVAKRISAARGAFDSIVEPGWDDDAVNYMRGMCAFMTERDY